MGKKSAPEIAASMGLYEDAALQRYVEDIGLRMAKISERPHLPWEFQVVDDPLVNAFAVPGGFIYVTRGILAHFNNEAQLASVLGHEIGHVTARHSVAQYTKQIGAQAVLIPAVVLVPELASVGQLLGAGVQVLLLKYGRDDETQSDRLGLQYMTRVGYAAKEMPEVFRTLDRIGAKSGAGGVPEWLSSHPKPANREALMKSLIAQLPDGAAEGKVGRKEFMDQIDGVVYGNDPRHGYFGDDGVFHHPDMAFRISFPRGWQYVNQRSVVGAVTQDQDAMLQLTLAQQDTPEDAARAFLSAEGLQSTAPRGESIGGLPAVTLDFAAAGQGGNVRGVAAFVRHDGRVFQILGVAPENRFATHDGTLRAALQSFGRERSAAVLNVKPWRIDVVTPRSGYSVAGFAQAYPGPASAEDLALMNGIDPGGRYAAGVPAKRVVGSPLP